MEKEFKPSYLTSKIRISNTDSNEQEKALASLDESNVEEIAKAKEKLGISREKQPDILYMEDILVSEGENKNDDIFLAEELASAVLKRDTVKGKPVNWEHDPHQIIGFMYDSFLIDADNNQIKEVPKDKKFHVVSRSMIWKDISASHRERAQAIALAEKDDSLFVSMEAFFKRFDFAVGEDIIERNENTAFLDFALRVNGGSGEFDGKRVRRVLRDITFGGKAVVEKPANPDSFIRSVAKDISNEVIPEESVLGKIKFVDNVNPDGVEARCEDITGKQEPVFASLVFEDTPPKEKLAVANTEEEQQEEENTNTQIGVDRMSENVELQKELSDAKAKIEDLTKQISEADVTKAKEEIDSLKADNEKHLETISELESKVAEKDEVEKTLEATKTDLAQASDTVKDLESKLNEMEAEKRLGDRKSQIEEIVSLDEEAMAKELETIKHLSDEDFVAHIERLNYVSTAAKKAVEDAAKAAEEEKTNQTTTANDTDQTIDDAIQNIEADEDGSINASSADEDAAMVDVFGDHFSGGK